MSIVDRIYPLRFHGKAYMHNRIEDNGDVHLVIDGGNAKGILLRTFPNRDMEGAKSLARLLNIWAGKEKDKTNA
jgi:hypothetical protein